MSVSAVLFRLFIRSGKKHGIRKGVILSIRRIFSCRKDVSMGTFDPVTEKGQGLILRVNEGHILNLK